MSNKLSYTFTVITGTALLIYSIFEIGRMIAGANMSTNEIVILMLLMIVNSVNMIHWPSSK